MSERMVRANGVDLCVETFGEPGEPTILLISGAGASMDWWNAEFCRRLAAGGRHVVRYDHRDTGRSVAYPQGAPGYTGSDLADDAVGLIEVLGVGRGHVVGVSMGGAIAQEIAVEHPEQVATLTLVATSPSGPGSPENGLPPMADRLAARFAGPAPEPDRTDRDAVAEYLVESERHFAGPDSFDEADTREAVRGVVSRTADLGASMRNHWLADGGAETRSRLAQVSAPTLVVHGDSDPLFPAGHALALSREITDSELLLLNGVGHQVPPRSTWDQVIPALLRHTTR